MPESSAAEEEVVNIRRLNRRQMRGRRGKGVWEGELWSDETPETRRRKKRSRRRGVLSKNVY